MEEKKGRRCPGCRRVIPRSDQLLRLLRPQAMALGAQPWGWTGSWLGPVCQLVGILLAGMS